MLAAPMRMGGIGAFLAATIFALQVSTAAADCSSAKAVNARALASGTAANRLPRDLDACAVVASWEYFNREVPKDYQAPERPLLRWWTLAMPLTIAMSSLMLAIALPAASGRLQEPDRAGAWHILQRKGARAGGTGFWKTIAVSYWLSWAAAIALDASHWGFDVSVLTTISGWLVLGLVLLALSAARSWIYRYVELPSVAVSEWPIGRGSDLKCRVGLQMRRRADLEAVTIGILAREMWRNKYSPPYRMAANSVQLGPSVAEEMKADGAYRFNVSLHVPSSAPPNGGRFRWFLVVHVDPVGAPGVDFEYPVNVV